MTCDASLVSKDWDLAFSGHKVCLSTHEDNLFQGD